MATTTVAVATMKVAQVSKPGADFRIVEREIPMPGADQVRIKVQACGVCHSDVLTKEGSWPGIQYPRVPGHEVAGIVDEVGAGVSAWKKGQRVGVGWHGGRDNTCRECRRGDFRNCRNLKIPGISYDGGYQQYMVAPLEALVAIPEILSDTEAAPLLCAGITTYNALRYSGASHRYSSLLEVETLKHSRLGCGNTSRFRGHTELCRTYGRASDDRDIPARKGGRGLRAHDQRQGRIPRRSDDVKLDGMARLLSVNVGLPRNIEWRGNTVHTGIWKTPIHGRCMVRHLNIDGDGQGDLGGHGGEQRAVMVYQLDSYRYWEAQLNRSFASYGQFGENLTVDGLADNEVCIGDQYRIGSALFEVTQPRVTCYRVGIRMDEPQMAALLVAHHRPGFYFRVLEEGEVSAGYEIVKVADGPERMTVAEIDALLYLPGHPRDQLERALRIPALSPGWQTSFQSLLAQQMSGKPLTGNPGLAPADQWRPSTPGFRSLRVSRIDRESSSVFSLTLAPIDALPLAAALPGQFVVLRLRPKPDEPPLLRSYSLSNLSSPDAYRVSIKEEIHGAGSSYLRSQVRLGDVLDVSTPRGSFTLRPGKGPVVLLSAGIGATPVLAMLHALAAEGSARMIWWLFGARNSMEHPFAQESRDLLRALPHGRSYVQYSRPRPEDRIGVDFDASGHLTVPGLERLGVPLDADFYICGPTAFLRDITNGLAARGITADRVHREVFGPGESTTPGVVDAFHRPPHQPPGPSGSGPSVSFGRSGITTQWGPAYQTLLELAEACDVPVRWSCRTGVCHTCESGLVSGTVRYVPEPLEPPAPGNVLICCSKPLDSVVIDL